MIKTLLTLYIPNSKNTEHKVWNSALRTVIIKLYQFFNAGELPKDISELFVDDSVNHDTVNHPYYYCSGGIETLDYILAKKMDFLLG